MPSPNDAEHRRASASLPWLLNGTASEADRRFVENHLQQCENCRTEWQQQQRWQAAMTRPRAGDVTPLPDPQAGLQRLWARIDTADAVAAAALPGDRRWPLAGTRRSGALVYGLMATVMVEAVALSVLGLEVAKPGAPVAVVASATPGMTSPPVATSATTSHVAATVPAALPGDYRTLSAVPDTVLPPGSLRVVFDRGVTLDALQQLLARTGLQVVAGPNQAGAFVLAPLQPGADPAALTAQLRARPGVRLVVPVSPAGQAP